MSAVLVLVMSAVLLWSEVSVAILAGVVAGGDCATAGGARGAAGAGAGTGVRCWWYY